MDSRFRGNDDISSVFNFYIVGRSSYWGQEPRSRADHPRSNNDFKSISAAFARDT